MNMFVFFKQFFKKTQKVNERAITIDTVFAMNRINGLKYNF